TRTLRLARARYAAAVRPLCPPPITIASYFMCDKPNQHVSSDRQYNPQLTMPIGTAVHSRTFPLCESLNYREWSGYYAVSAYEAHHETKDNAIRNAAALIDVTPLYKYLVTGPDAVKLVDRIITRDAYALAPGQVYYTPWCDEQGKVIDDG